MYFTGWFLKTNGITKLMQPTQKAARLIRSVMPLKSKNYDEPTKDPKEYN